MRLIAEYLTVTTSGPFLHLQASCLAEIHIPIAGLIWLAYNSDIEVILIAIMTGVFDE